MFGDIALRAGYKALDAALSPLLNTYLPPVCHQACVRQTDQFVRLSRDLLTDPNGLNKFIEIANTEGAKILRLIGLAPLRADLIDSPEKRVFFALRTAPKILAALGSRDKRELLLQEITRLQEAAPSLIVKFKEETGLKPAPGSPFAKLVQAAEAIMSGAKPAQPSGQGALEVQEVLHGSRWVKRLRALKSGN